MTEVAEQMQLAAQLARSGEREQALCLFEQVIIRNPGEAEAWLWISELADTLDEQVAALERAVACIDASADGSRTLQERLNAIRESHSLPAPAMTEADAESAGSEGESCTEAMVQWAERLVILGENREARRVLESLLEEEPHNEHALLLLSELAGSPEEELLLLQQVLEHHPESTEATRRVEQLNRRAGARHPVQSQSRLEARQPKGLLHRAKRIFSR